MTVSCSWMVHRVLLMWVTTYTVSLFIRVLCGSEFHHSTISPFSTLCFSSRTPSMPRFNLFTSFQRQRSPFSVVELILCSVFRYLALSLLFFSCLVPCYAPFLPFRPLLQPRFGRQVLLSVFFLQPPDSHVWLCFSRRSVWVIWLVRSVFSWSTGTSRWSEHWTRSEGPISARPRSVSLAFLGTPVPSGIVWISFGIHFAFLLIPLRFILSQIWPSLSLGFCFVCVCGGGGDLFFGFYWRVPLRWRFWWLASLITIWYQNDSRIHDLFDNFRFLC